MPRLVFIVSLAVLIVVGTLLVGWLSLPLAGAGAGLVFATRSSLFVPASMAGACGWASLLVFNASTGEVARVADAAGAVLGVPAVAFTLLTIVFASLVTGCSALAVQYLRWLINRLSSGRGGSGAVSR